MESLRCLTSLGLGHDVLGWILGYRIVGSMLSEHLGFRGSVLPINSSRALRASRVIRTTLEHVCQAVETEGSRPPGLLVVGHSCEVLHKPKDGQRWVVEEGFRSLDAVGSCAAELDILKELGGSTSHEVKKKYEVNGDPHSALLHPVIAHPGVTAS